MSMKVTYRVDVYNGSSWVTDANWKSISIDRSVFWDSPGSAQIELDNHRGTTRALYAIARQVKIYRNNVLFFYGIITKPKSWADKDGHHTAVELLDFYHWKLRSKETGETEIWKFTGITPAEIARAMIGTRFIHEDLYNDTHRILSLTNAAVQDGTVSIVKDASGYLATGTVESIPLYNGEEPGLMGDISAATVYVYPDTQYLNMAPNPHFEEDMPDISTSADWVSMGWFGNGISSGHREITRVSTEYHAGTHSMRLYNDNSTPATTVRLITYNPVANPEAGSVWQTECWVKGSGIGYVRVLWKIGASYYIQYTSFTATSTWTHYVATKTLPANVSYVSADITGDTGTTQDFYVDDVFFGRVPADGDITVGVGPDGEGITNVPMTYDTGDGRWEGTVNSFENNLVVSNAGASYDFSSSTGWTLMGSFGATAVIGSGVLTLTGSGGNYAIASCPLTNIRAGSSHTFQIRARYKNTSGVADTLFLNLDGTGYKIETYFNSGVLTTSFQTFTTTFDSGTPPSRINLNMLSKSTRPIEIDWVIFECNEHDYLKYKLTINRESLTSAPVVEGIEIHATTASDTSLIEGTINDYVPPEGYAATMDKDYGDSNREDGISSIYKTVGMEAIINIATGALSLQTIPAAVSSGTLTLGTNLLSLVDERDLLPCANAIIFTGSGQISQNENFTHRVYLKDATSIAAIGRIGKAFKGKDNMTIGTVNNRAYNVLYNVSTPPRNITGILVDPRTTAITIGAWYVVDDPTEASGIDSEILRVMSESRNIDTGGETVTLTLSNLGYNPDPEAQFNNFAKNIEAFGNTAQAANGIEITPAVGNCKNAVPLMLTFYIHENRDVVNIELTARSEKYKDYQSADVVENAYYAPCQIYINGDYEASPMVPTPDFGIRGDKDNPFNVRRLNLTQYYSADLTNKLKPGLNTIYLKPMTVATYNTQGLMYINASIKVSYSN